jgi:hypothetical protein
MKGLKQEKRGATNSLVFTNADNSVGTLSFDGAKFGFSDPVTFEGSQLLLPNGTVANPSLAFTNSDGLGLYRYGSNVLGFVTAGNVRAYLTAGGVLQIGSYISLDSIAHTITGDRKSITAGTTTTVLTAADSGKVFNIKAVGAATYTLPAPAAGLYFKWIWSIDNTDAVIIKTADLTDTDGDMFRGGLLVCAAAAVNTFVEASGDHNTITMEDDAAKCGGGVGSWIEIICTEDPTWYVRGIVNSNSDADNVGVGLFSDAD